MKALWMAALTCICGLAVAQNQVELRALPGSPGYVDDHTVDVAAFAPGDKIMLGVYVNDLDFTLAGFEARLDFLSPTLAMEDQDADFQDGNAPLKAGADWGGAPVVLLPSNSSGNQTATTVNNSFGTFRLGVLVTDPLQRPTGNGADDYQVATVEIILNDVDSDCTTANTDIRLFMCSAGGGDCDIFADDTASRVAMSFSNMTRTVSIINTAVTASKGDFNGDDSADTADVVPAINCANQIGSCPIDADPDEELIGDVNCSGGTVNTGDIIPLINLANQISGRSSGKRGVAMDPVAGEGAFVINQSGMAGAMFTYELDVTGQVDFAPIAVSSNGWYVTGKHHRDSGVYKVIGAYLPGGNADMPSFEITYRAEKGAAMGLSLTEQRDFNNRPVRSVPAIDNTGIIGPASPTRIDDGRN
jgi:hypothetical protein